MLELSTLHTEEKNEDEGRQRGECTTIVVKGFEYTFLTPQAHSFFVLFWNEQENWPLNWPLDERLFVCVAANLLKLSVSKVSLRVQLPDDSFQSDCGGVCVGGWAWRRVFFCPTQSNTPPLSVADTGFSAECKRTVPIEAPKTERYMNISASCYRWRWIDVLVKRIGRFLTLHDVREGASLLYLCLSCISTACQQLTINMF